jgi:hypothetical protein
MVGRKWRRVARQSRGSARPIVIARIISSRLLRPLAVQIALADRPARGPPQTRIATHHAQTMLGQRVHTPVSPAGN